MSTERTPLVTDERIATLAESYADMMMTKNDGESYSTHLGGYEFGAKELRNRYEAELARKDAEIEALRNPWISVEELDKELAPVFQALDWGETRNAISLLAEARTRLTAAATNNTNDNEAR